MANALDLMAVGMGFVFTFLIILVFVTMAMSRIAMRLTPPEPATPAKKTKSGGSDPANDSRLTAVISAAIEKHRSRHKR
ncbi:MAG: OadG family protein [Oleiphilaceae bacterium]|nr:OadG family protein [Oleiphilaceae bacterium]